MNATEAFSFHGELRTKVNEATLTHRHEIGTANWQEKEDLL